MFATTHWSVVLAAGNEPSADSRVALERLCRVYWYPIYAQVRRRGYSEPDAKDLTQAFFAHLIERNSFQRVSPAKGKFRSFLLASLKYFLSDTQDRERAKKRGSGIAPVPLHTLDAEARFAQESIDDKSPDRTFDRAWAVALLDQVLALLKREFEVAGKAAQFEHLSSYLVPHAGAVPYAETARRFGYSEEMIKKAVQRMRKRFGVLVRGEIAKTVASPQDAEVELRYLCEVLAL